MAGNLQPCRRPRTRRARFLTINASTSGATVPFSLWLNANPPFTLSTSPGNQTVNSAGGATYQISISSGPSFAGQVALSLTSSPQLPAGSWNFSSSSVPAPGGSLLTLSLPSAGATTTYALTITGTSGSTTATTTSYVTVPASNTNLARLTAAARGDHARRHSDRVFLDERDGGIAIPAIGRDDPDGTDVYSVSTQATSPPPSPYRRQSSPFTLPWAR